MSVFGTNIESLRSQEEEDDVCVEMREMRLKWVSASSTASQAMIEVQDCPICPRQQRAREVDIIC